MAETRIIKAVFGASKSIVAPKRYKHDYGQEIEFVGIDLPNVFEAHFSNNKTGQAKKQIGQDNVVTVPDEYFVSGADVFCWVMAHDEATDGRTMYTVRIPVMERPEPINAEPTPVQQDIIAETITALNGALDRAEASESAWENMSADSKVVKEEIDALSVDLSIIQDELDIQTQQSISAFSGNNKMFPIPTGATRIAIQQIGGKTEYNDNILKIGAINAIKVYASSQLIRQIDVPLAITGLSGYGVGFDPTRYNYVDFDNGKFHVVCNVVDLGTLDWKYSSTYNRFTTVNPVDGISVPNDNNSMNVGDYIIYGAEYTLTTMNNTSNTSYNKKYAISASSSASGKIAIRDEDYTDAATFKAHLSGIYLLYLLETEFITDITDTLSGTVYDGETVEFYTADGLAVNVRGQFTVTVVTSIKQTVEENAESIDVLNASVAEMGETVDLVENGTIGFYDITDTVLQLAIQTGVGVGDTVSLKPYVNTSCEYQIIDCEKGDKFRVNTQSGSGTRGWCFIDTDNKCLSVCSPSQVVSNQIITAPDDGKLIVTSNSRTIYPVKLEKYGKIPLSNQSNIEEVKSRDAYEYPMVIFDFDHNMRDVSSELAKISYADRKLILPQIYALYDALVAAYPEFVSKVDAAQEMGITYPAYANGTTDDLIYGTTPAYKTYMYKFVTDFPYIGNNGTQKHKKMLLVTGTHGWEVAAPFAGYLFIKQLCDGFLNDPNFFKFRNAWDVYVIPCLDGWAMYHESRTNANGVNVNRNYPTSFWVEDGQGTTNYTGSVAGSEFENRVVMAETLAIKPDLAIDLHNYSATNRQFYTGVSETKWLRLAYQSLTDCTFAFKKLLPQYFGSNFGALINYNSLDAPERLGLPLPSTNAWWHEQDYIKMSSTVEICENIRYLNGEYTDTAQGNDQFGADTFSVAEYTVRNLIFRYAQWVMQNSAS